MTQIEQFLLLLLKQLFISTDRISILVPLLTQDHDVLLLVTQFMPQIVVHLLQVQDLSLNYDRLLILDTFDRHVLLLQ